MAALSYGGPEPGHLVLVRTECCRPRPLLTVSKLCRQHRWAWLSQIFYQMSRSRLDSIMNAECFIRIDLDRSRFDKNAATASDYQANGLLTLTLVLAR